MSKAWDVWRVHHSYGLIKCNDDDDDDDDDFTTVRRMLRDDLGLELHGGRKEGRKDNSYCKQIRVL